MKIECRLKDNDKNASRRKVLVCLSVCLFICRRGSRQKQRYNRHPNPPDESDKKKENKVNLSHVIVEFNSPDQIAGSNCSLFFFGKEGNKKQFENGKGCFPFVSFRFLIPPTKTRDKKKIKHERKKNNKKQSSLSPATDAELGDCARALNRPENRPTCCGSLLGERSNREPAMEICDIGTLFKGDGNPPGDEFTPCICVSCA